MEGIQSPPAPPPGATADAQLDALLRLIIEGFFVLTDGQGALSKWSDPAEMLFGHEADDALMEPFFGKLVSTGQLTPEAERWRAFLETGTTPGPAGVVRVDAQRPDGAGTFAMETVFIPVKLDEGFDFSLFLEDLGFELPMDMMLLRMRQQHPVVVRALRGALEASQQPWDSIRTAGTLVAFRALEPTPWMDEAMARREAERDAAEAELQSRIEALDVVPEVQGTDVYDLDDARAVIDRLRWATERIEELEQRSHIADDAVQQAHDARVRAEAAERAALDVKAEMSGVLAERPVDASGEAERLELLARVDRIERAATSDATEAAAAHQAALEAERTRSRELEAQRTELLARLEQVEAAAGSTSVAEAAVADARAELTARMEALERAGAHDVTTGAELVGRLEALERARAAEAAELREKIERLRASTDVRDDLQLLQDQVAETSQLREEILTLRERADAASAVMRRGEERESAALFDARAAREELAAALSRVEQLSEETARIRAHLEAAPSEAGLSSEDRHRLELAAAGVTETRTGLEAIRFLAEELRTQSADLREEGGRLQQQLNELADTDHHAWQEREGLRRDHDELRTHLDELRSEREEIKATLRETARTAEEARTLAERPPSESGNHVAPASADEIAAARERLDELAAQIEAAEGAFVDARAEMAGLRHEVGAVVDTAEEARRLAREAENRVDMVDRANQTALAQVSTQAAIIEEIGALARAAQGDSQEGRASAGEAVAALGRLEKTVAVVREQAETAVAEAAVAREQAAAAGQSASGVRGMVAGVGEAAREAVAPVAETVQAVQAQLEAVRVAVDGLEDRPAGDPAVGEELEQIRAEVRSLRTAMDSAEGGFRPEGGSWAAVQALTGRLDAVEESLPRGIDARMETLRDGLTGALGKLEAVSTDVAAARSETGAGRQLVEQRLADTAAELMAARTDAESARRGLEGLQGEVASLREYAASAKAEAEAAREAVARASRSGAGDDRAVAELRTEVAAAMAKLGDIRGGFEEARQAAVAARREAELARAAAEKAGAVNEATGEKFTEVWQKMLTAAPRKGDSGVRTALGRAGASKPKPAPEAREPREGFDDDPRPLAVLDLKGKFRDLNPGFQKLVGYQEHQFSKATWPSVLDRKVYAEQKAELDAMAAGTQERAVVDSTYMHGQGLMVLIRGDVQLVRDDAGEPDHLLLVAEAGGPTG